MQKTLEQRVVDLETRVLALETTRRLPPDRKSDPNSPSPREFLMEKLPRTDTDKTLTAGFYIEMISGHASFDFDDIDRFYNEAKEASPANRRDPPYQLVEEGFFRKVGKRATGKNARNRWALTNDGIARVEHGFKSGGSR